MHFHMDFFTNTQDSSTQRKGLHLDRKTVRGLIRRLHRFPTAFLASVEASIGLPMLVIQQRRSDPSHSLPAVVNSNRYCKDTLLYRSTLTHLALRVILLLAPRKKCPPRNQQKCRSVHYLDTPMQLSQTLANLKSTLGIMSRNNLKVARSYKIMPSHRFLHTTSSLSVEDEFRRRSYNPF
jgi:hypothetical protein